MTDTDREARLEEIRDLVAREKAGKSVSDLYSAARLLDATVWLLSEIDRLRETSGILLDVLEDMKLSGADVPAELDYAVDDLRHALPEPSAERADA